MTMSTAASTDLFAAALAEKDWYHGLMPREDIKMMLRSNGDFLVRSTEPKAGQPRCFVLSVMFNQDKEEDGIKHYIITRTEDNKFFIEKNQFNGVAELVQHHVSTKESLVKANNVVLLKGIGRTRWEFNHTDVTPEKKLGEGAFGEVHKGQLKLPTGKSVAVAIKMAKLEQLTKDQIKEIMSEARLMRLFDHPNVVRFYGVAAGQEPLMVMMELASNGSLDSFLQKNQLPVDKLVEMMMQAAWGVEYIHSKNVLHRDLAARNCLYGDGNVKIADFGLSREGTVYQMDPHKRVPIRWLAPETLRMAIYTQKTDVWAFGIMSWEIFSQGQEPYPGMTVAEVNNQVKEGYRMELPATISPDLQKIIKKCWADGPNDRFAMADVVKQMQRATGLKFKPPPAEKKSLFSKEKKDKKK